MWAEPLPPGGSRGESVSLPFSPASGARVPGVWPLPPPAKSIPPESASVIVNCLSSGPDPPVSLSQGRLGGHQATWTIQDGRLSQDPSLNLTAKSPSQRRRQSQVLGLGAGHVWGMLFRLPHCDGLNVLSPHRSVC